MKVLFDHCVPEPFRAAIVGHSVATTHEMDWSDHTNGELLALAATQFDVFFTVDQNIEYERNLKTLPLPVVILVAPTNRLQTLLPYAPAILQALAGMTGDKLIRINADLSIVRIA